MTNPKPYVFKFGGTSLQNAELIQNAATIIAKFDKPLTVVTSAVGGVTNLLMQIVQDDGDRSTIRQQIGKIHQDIAGDLGLENGARRQYLDYLHETLDDIDKAAGLAPGPASDLILSIGERLSTPLVAAAVRSVGRSAEYVDARELLRTDSRYGEARIDEAETNKRVQAQLPGLFHDGVVAVVSGFVGSDEDGNTTTIGRNGSDLSATIIGAALQAGEVWIWTDVSGLYTANPKAHNSARRIHEISFRAAAEAAYFGASVLHPHTIWPLLETEVPLRIKNAANPEDEGTLITAKPQDRGNVLITASIENVSIITIGGYGMLGMPGVAATIFNAVHETGASVFVISQSSSEHNISLVVKQSEVAPIVDKLKDRLSDWMERDHVIDRIKVVPEVAIITVVGENMPGRVGIAGRIFTALGERRINVIAIAQGSSEYSISIVLSRDRAHDAIDAIHTNLGNGVPV